MINLLKDKQLVFLEKNINCPSSKDCIDSAKTFLSVWLDMPNEQIEAMIIHYQFEQMSMDKINDILFNPNNIIVSYSVYLQGSGSSFNYYMANIGFNGLTGLTYIDTSGALIRFLNTNLKDIEDSVFETISAINTNNIITYNRDSDSNVVEAQLIKIDIKGVYDDCVVLKDLLDENILTLKAIKS